MATGAAAMMLRCVFDGSLSMSDMDIERRPYHKNCSCALHKQKGKNTSTCVHSRNISFPKRKNCKDMTLSIAASQFSSQSSPCDNSLVMSVQHTAPMLARKRREKEMASGAAEIILQCVVDGSLSMLDMDIERRPYHRNCSCALHKKKGKQPNTCVHGRNISPKRQKQKDMTLSIAASKFSSPTSSSDNSPVRSVQHTTPDLASS
ncbi:hypothetical protein HAX54_013840 [Datura stramonium]|uniref:Copper-fist domain-containing protein n=1 Tax=Datura stramonium TaxID=4076 RepID=A0ABS8TPS4_DATST|nr:hypothetical protein [Datura stramonium]